ncbi:MAG: PEP/pyruvate-binding domain-containing protein [bacterium]
MVKKYQLFKKGILSNKYIRDLNNITINDISLVGSKGAKLGEMKKAKFPVPPGFCITADAYEYYLQYNEIQDEIVKIVKDTFISFSSLKSEAYKIKNLILSGHIPLELRNEIISAYHKLRGYVSIRSSATYEDLSITSSAGIYDTYLNIIGENEVLKKVVEVFASLWSERAISYREAKFSKNEVTIGIPKMAVIIQQMISAQVSGIIFTSNPVDKDLVIEGSFGLGEIIVKGKVTPDRYVINKRTLKISEKTLSTKDVMIIPDQSPNQVSMGVLEIYVPQEKKDRQILLDREIKKLARLGLNIERYYRVPQDIEWAYNKGKFYILQTRPVTAIPEKVTIWSNFNWNEIIPGVLSPFTWSMLNEVIQNMIKHIMRKFGFPPVELPPIIELLYGRVYWNMNNLLEVFKDLSFFEEIGGKEAILAVGEKVPNFRIKIILMCLQIFRFNIFKLLNVIYKISCIFFKMHRDIEKVYFQVRKTFDKFEKVDLSKISLEELLSFRILYSEEAKEVMLANVLGGGLVISSYQLLGKITKRWLDDKDGILQAKLIGGMLDETVKMDIEIWKLAQKASTSEYINSIFSERNEEEIISLLKEKGEGREFLIKLKEFLSEYGHRCSMEYDFMVPRWIEEPRFILSMIKNYLKNKVSEEGLVVNPIRHLKNKAIEQEKIILKSLEKLSSGIFNKLFPIKRFIFKKAIQNLQRNHSLRETPKFYAMMLWMAARMMILEVGNRLFEEGVLLSKDDIFFLNINETRKLVKGEFSKKKALQLVTERRQEYEHNLKLKPPSIIRSDSFLTFEEEKLESSSYLEGVGVSPGKVTGKARIIFDINKSWNLRKGEILVVPYTDPAWTPLFLIAAGVITDIGGLLSHGAIIAREYGIPAVMGVKNGTKTIEEGRTITVDGNEGRVYLY